MSYIIEIQEWVKLLQDQVQLNSFYYICQGVMPQINCISSNYQRSMENTKVDSIHTCTGQQSQYFLTSCYYKQLYTQKDYQQRMCILLLKNIAQDIFFPCRGWTERIKSDMELNFGSKLDTLEQSILCTDTFQEFICLQRWVIQNLIIYWIFFKISLNIIYVQLPDFYYVKNWLSVKKEEQNTQYKISKQQDKLIQQKVTKMFQGTRLNYIVPGYTGHIPKKVYDSTTPLQKKEGTSQIPGYAGFVHSIKAENIHADTFGKITYNVNNDNYVRGQDLQPSQKYVTVQTKTNIAPSEMLRRTAAQIVGIPNKQIKIQEPRLGQSTGPEVDQFTITKTEQFKNSMTNQSSPWAKTRVIQKQGKQYVKLEQPLPGYTGFNKRILANNIFGKTFAECRKQSHRDSQKLHHERNNNFQTQLKSDVPLKF